MQYPCILTCSPVFCYSSYILLKGTAVLLSGLFFFKLRYPCISLCFLEFISPLFLSHFWKYFSSLLRPSWMLNLSYLDSFHLWCSCTSVLQERTGDFWCWMLCCGLFVPPNSVRALIRQQMCFSAVWVKIKLKCPSSSQVCFLYW